MGALHQGHISLIQQAVKENAHVVCSIFINPTQFNNKEDFEKYPNTLSQDLEKLEDTNCSVAFVPNQEEMYPEGTEKVKHAVNLHPLDKVMEGAHRPGHFQGVCQVVDRLFEIVQPTRAYFGEKDFQQLRVIQQLTKQVNHPIEIVPCEIIREQNGLAMSSRNLRLTPAQREEAAFLYQQLKGARDKWKKESPESIKEKVEKAFSEHPNLSLEYFEVAEEETLQPITNNSQNQPARAFIAAFLGNVRLIDNLRLFP